MNALPRWLRLALPGLVLIVGVVSLRLFSAPEAPLDIDAELGDPADADEGTVAAIRPATEDDPSAPPAGDGATDARRQIARRITPERYREVLAQIRAARGEAAAEAEPEAAPEGAASARPAAPPAPATPPEPFGSLDAQYIQDAIRELVPLFAECYELAREDDDSLAGRLVMEMTIGGEEEVGGVIERAAIADDSELHHPVLDECVRETAYTVELPAPDGGGQVEVRYPLTFSPDDPDEDEATGTDPSETPAGP